MSSIRGNVGTRLAKLDQGEFDAIVLAAAGLQRLGLARQDVYPIATDICLPAPGQGALGIECVADSPVLELLQPLVDVEVDRCVRAERGVSAGLGADCALPVAAMASSADTGHITLSALVSNDIGYKHSESAGIWATTGRCCERSRRTVVQCRCAAGIGFEYVKVDS